jgi:ribosomal protein S12 methylthiotransferase accessory factor
MLLFGANAFATKTYLHGTHSTRTRDDTTARLQPLMAAFGITRVANLTGLDRTGLPVVMVCRPNARSSSVFHGKGINLEAAKASGLMEAIETWHAEHVQLPLRFGSFNDLVPTLRLAEAGCLPRLPDSWFHADLPMLWVEGHDLIAGHRVLLPFETVHANSSVPGPPSSECFSASTNGLASGNNLLEAVSHALCEVIERPVLQSRMRLDLSTVNDDDCRWVLERLREASLNVAVWEITSDVGVPAFHCLAQDQSCEIDQSVTIISYRNS